jgi:hypothetical protein
LEIYGDRNDWNMLAAVNEPKTPQIGTGEAMSGSSIVGGFLVEDEMTATKWGPFRSADKAAQWAIDHLPAGAHWVIRPYLNPDREK